MLCQNVTFTNFSNFEILMDILINLYAKLGVTPFINVNVCKTFLGDFQTLCICSFIYYYVYI